MVYTSTCTHKEAIIEVSVDHTSPVIYERECLDCGYIEQGYVVETIKDKKRFFVPLDNVPELMEVADSVEFYNGEINTRNSSR